MLTAREWVTDYLAANLMSCLIGVDTLGKRLNALRLIVKCAVTNG